MRGKRISIGRNNIKIRLANISDIKQLVELRIIQQHDDWGSEYNDYDNHFYDRTLSEISNFLCKNNNEQSTAGVIFIAEKDNKIIATCGLQIINMLPQCNDNGKHGYLFNVFTAEEFRKQGIQSLLIDKTLAYAKELSIEEISLQTDSEIAIKLYKKNGFKFNKLSMVVKL